MARCWSELATRLEAEASEDDRHTLLQQVAARQVALSTTPGPLGGAPQPSPTAYHDLLNALLYSVLTNPATAATVRTRCCHPPEARMSTDPAARTRCPRTVRQVH